jgi:thioredoxin reductase (NADPH)
MEINSTGTSSGTLKPFQVEEVNVLVLGAGPAGMSAALYLARAELKPLVLTGMELGGQVGLTHTIENYPGFPDGVGGLQLGELFQKQAEKFGARFELETASSADLTKTPMVVRVYGKEINTKALIIATGASPIHLQVPGEKELTGRGVSYCATCDGWFFKGKQVIVVGGGDSALEESLFLTRFASSVNVIHRREALRAGAILQSRARENPKIGFTWDTVVTEILGSEAVTGVRAKNVKTGEERIIPADGIFIFIGHKPNTEMFKGQVDLDERGYVLSNESMKTNIPGVFVAGEAADPLYRQVVTSAGMGAAAAIQATRYLESMEG